MVASQARRQDSVTGGVEINFGGHKKFIYVNSRGAREIYPSLDQMNKVKTKDLKGFSGRNRKFKRFFRPKTGDLQKKRVFIPKTYRNRQFKQFFRPKTGDLQKKKGSSSQKRTEIGNPSGFSDRKQVISKKKVFTNFVRDFPAEIGNSNGFSDRKQVISKKKTVFIPKTSWNPMSVHEKHQFEPRFAFQ